MRTDKSAANGNHGFGTAPVFFTAISTILGAVLFLRFGYAVGNVGFFGTLVIVLVGHVVTICTALALAEIATNKRVEGGGEYFVISRSFGIVPGAAIGLTLFTSQAVSVAFYVIAFAEAFSPLNGFLLERYGFVIADPRMISVPALFILGAVILSRGADLGIRALYVVVTVLFLALVSFFLGSPLPEYVDPGGIARLAVRVEDADPFFIVFAIVFPAFTGMTAGVGLSGDLRDPRRSIPIGTLSATVFGMFVYIAVAYKLVTSAGPDVLDADQLVMQRIAIWGPIIPIGLAAATISSALGSILVAPRTLQAIAQDRVFPSSSLGEWLARCKGEANEPRNATIVVIGVALVFVLIGNVNVVAQIISMFFMVTYGSLCLISFFEHMASSPEYRPSFSSRWYISLLGASTCLWLMFRMSPWYATAAIAVMVGIYGFIHSQQPERQGLAHIFQGLIFQVNRGLQVFMQRVAGEEKETTWRPSVVCLSAVTFDSRSGFDLLRWIAHRYGFGTYLHFIQGYLSKETIEERGAIKDRLVRMNAVAGSHVYVDALISPSYTTAICQAIQLPGVSGKPNNMLLFEFYRGEPRHIRHIIDNFPLVQAAGLDVIILSVSQRSFGYRRTIHVWLKPSELENASLMILLGYIMLGHSDWGEAEVRIFVIAADESRFRLSNALMSKIREGRLPISPRNIERIPASAGVSPKDIIRERSRNADLTILGIQPKLLKHEGASPFEGFEGMGDILFVHSASQIALGDSPLELAEDSLGASKNVETTPVGLDSPEPSPEDANVNGTGDERDAEREANAGA